MMKLNKIAVGSLMALIMMGSVSMVAFAREAESGGGDRNRSGRSSTHIEIGDDHGGLRPAGVSDDEVHRSSGLHNGINNDDGGLRGDGSLDDNHNNRGRSQVSGSVSVSSSPAVIESRIAELVRIIDGLIEQLRRQISA